MRCLTINLSPTHYTQLEYKEKRVTYNFLVCDNYIGLDYNVHTLKALKHLH